MSQRRLFVALRPPEAVCDVLLDTMEGLAGARWQDADNLHITLRFVGEVDRHTQRDLESALSDIDFAAFRIAVEGVGHFQGKKRARAIWARIAPNAELNELQRRVEYACRRAGLPVETRKFIPHITLARLNSGSADPRDWLSRNARLAPEPWLAGNFSLFESDLTPQGAIYSEIAAFQ